jgi:hypothetical protein
MKIIITESQYKELFNDLPNSLKRRMTDEDFKSLDSELDHYTGNPEAYPNFEDYLEVVIFDLIHDFVHNTKQDEFDIVLDPEHGEVYNEDTFSKIMALYGKLTPILSKRYRYKLVQIWSKAQKGQDTEH